MNTSKKNNNRENKLSDRMTKYKIVSLSGIITIFERSAFWKSVIHKIYNKKLK